MKGQVELTAEALVARAKAAMAIEEIYMMVEMYVWYSDTELI